MILRDGVLNYYKFTKNEFVTETVSWNGINCVGIVCDDPTSAINDIGMLIISENDDNNKEVRIYNADIGTMNFLRNQIDQVEVRTDKIFDYQRRRNSYLPPIEENVQDLINFEYLKKEAEENNYIVIFFMQINPSIISLDRNASEIVIDYKYVSPFNSSNKRHLEMKKQISKYYIYDQDEDFIYDFKTFS